MDAASDQTVQPDSQEIAHPFVTIWTRPKQTVRALLKSPRSSYQLIILAALAGVANTLDRASSRHMGDKLAISTILLFAIVLGPLFGVMTLYIGSAAIAWAGRKINGHATANDLRVAMAWSAVPTVAALLFWAIGIVFVGRALFTSAPPQGMDTAASMVIVGIPMVGLGIWSIVLLAKSVGEVQGFSAWKGLGNVALGGLVLLVPIFVIGVVAAILIPLLAK
jgi:hypothetical protein